jgi:2-desacetyl-2-hydroxyethyl bacteriochlorophyllide A dehydrogenase
LISAGTEILIYRGEAVVGSPLNPMSEGSYAFPIKYGYQCVGRIERAGRASGFSEGERVFARHPHQGLFNIPTDRNLVVRLPASVSDASAAFLNLAEVALTAVLDVPVRIGDVVVVFGQGVVGMLCARLARMTAGGLVAVDPYPLRRRLALEFGADLSVAPDATANAVRQLSNGRGADVSFEASGAPGALQSALELTGQEGTVVVLSHYGTRDVHLRLAPEFHWRRVRIVSSQTATIGSGLQPRWNVHRRSEVALDLLSRMPVEPMISARIPFSNAPKAYQIADEQPETVLGVLLDYAS